MTMRLTSATAWLVIVVVLAWVAPRVFAIDVKIDHDKAFDFKGAQTWTWSAKPGDVKMARTQQDDPEAMRKIAEPVIMVWEDASQIGFPKNTPAPGNYNEWKVANRSFSDMAATRGHAASLTGDGAPEQVIGRAVTANFFNVLGVRPALGRSFASGEDTTGAAVVIISHALWQRRYHGDPRIVGRTMVMNNAKYEVIGIAPKSFVFRDRDIDYWIPMQLSPQQINTLRDHFLNVVARLRPGATVATADAEMKAIARRMMRIGTWLAAWSKHDPSIPHTHLGPIAVDPDAQGRHIGQRLMEEYCHDLDRTRAAGYLETDRPENVRFYRRFGFAMTDEIDVLGVRNYLMLRERKAWQ